ncbi:hypothetical protein NIES2104_43570 [Leptolyngbya sp. NIES-2104]|nr:hypothetical protein NIES2104_43570 [Leptolyngbya sp. NIES-2104]
MGKIDWILQYEIRLWGESVNSFYLNVRVTVYTLCKVL